ncbi:hypothetical protein SGL43_01109 [Streptomyces globisporus]|uniref:Uncharacterized protein n=1 Tax=Streptomyces globisporus TaxID=1908 RepID=A0ABM9GRR4_STRGL|nr:hypothetical protein SGL43_01109 [Streptomyces globisporus]
MQCRKSALYEFQVAALSPIRRKPENNKAPDEAFPSGAHNVHGYQNCNADHPSTPSPAAVDHDAPPRVGAEIRAAR